MKRNPKQAKANGKTVEIITSRPELVVPKTCNRVNLAKDQYGNVIMTMLFVDPANQTHVLIDRVYLDKAQAVSVAELFAKILK